MLHIKQYLGLACLGASVLGCNDSTGPDRASVAGTYSATSFTSTTAGVMTDELAIGATVNIVLTAQGTTTGLLFIPEGNEDGSDFTADLAGTWSLFGPTVSFQHAVETFIREMTFSVAGNTLVGDRVFGATRVRLTLTRQ